MITIIIVPFLKMEVISDEAHKNGIGSPFKMLRNKEVTEFIGPTPPTLKRTGKSSSRSAGICCSSSQLLDSTSNSVREGESQLPSICSCGHRINHISTDPVKLLV